MELAIASQSTSWATGQVLAKETEQHPPSQLTATWRLTAACHSVYRLVGSKTADSQLATDSCICTNYPYGRAHDVFADHEIDIQNVTNRNLEYANGMKFGAWTQVLSTRR